MSGKLQGLPQHGNYKSQVIVMGNMDLLLYFIFSCMWSSTLTAYDDISRNIHVLPDTASSKNNLTEIQIFQGLD